MENANNFRWIEFYQEFANKLLEYKDKRTELAEKIRIVEAPIHKKNSIVVNIDNIDDVDPFSIVAFISNIGDIKKKAFLENIKQEFVIECPTPSAFNGVPEFSATNFSEKATKVDIDNLWALFEGAINYADNGDEYNRNKFIKFYNLVHDIDGIDRDISVALYYIRPYKYLSLDKHTKSYIKQNMPNIKIPGNVQADVYLNIIERMREMDKCEDFPSLTHKAIEVGRSCNTQKKKN